MELPNFFASVKMLVGEDEPSNTTPSLVLESVRLRAEQVKEVPGALSESADSCSLVRNPIRDQRV